MECAQCSSHAFLKEYEESVNDESSTDSRKSFEEYYIPSCKSKNVNNNLVPSEPDQLMKMECGDTEVIPVGKQNLVQCSCLDQFSRKNKSKTKVIKKNLKSQIPQILNRNTKNRTKDEKTKVKSQCDFEVFQQKRNDQFNEGEEYLCGDIETNNWNRREKDVNDIPTKATSGNSNKTSIDFNTTDGCTAQNDQFPSAINKQPNSRRDLGRECRNKCTDSSKRVIHHNSRGDDEGVANPDPGLCGGHESKKNLQCHRSECNQNYADQIPLHYASESGMSTMEEDTSDEDRSSSHSTTTYKSEYEINEYHYNKWISKQPKSPIRNLPQINRSSNPDYQRNCQRGPPLLVGRHKSNCYLYKMLCDEADQEKYQKPGNNEEKSKIAKSNESLDEVEENLCHACIQTNSSQTDPCDREFQEKQLQKLFNAKQSNMKKNDCLFRSKQENQTRKESANESKKGMPSHKVPVDEATYIIKSSETMQNEEELKETRQKHERIDSKKQFVNERHELLENKQKPQINGNDRHKTKSPYFSYMNDENVLKHGSKEHHLNESKIHERPRLGQQITENQTTKDLIRDKEAKCVNEIISRNHASEHKHSAQNLAKKELGDGHKKEKLKERLSEGICDGHGKAKSNQTPGVREFVNQTPLCESVSDIPHQQRSNRRSNVRKFSHPQAMEDHDVENVKRLSGNRSINRQTDPQQLTFVQKVIRQKSLEDVNCRMHNPYHQPSKMSSKSNKLQGAAKDDFNVVGKTKEVKVSKKDSIINHGQRILTNSRPSVSLIKKTRGENARQHTKAKHEPHECFTSTCGDQGQQRKTTVVRNSSKNRGYDTDNYAIGAMKRMGLNWNE